MNLVRKQWIKFGIRSINFDLLPTSHYSSDPAREQFYLWIEKNALSFKLSDQQRYSKEIRKIIYECCNKPADDHLYVHTFFVELYMEKSGIPIEEAVFHTQKFKSRMCQLNKIGSNKLFDYYQQDKKILIE